MGLLLRHAAAHCVAAVARRASSRAAGGLADASPACRRRASRAGSATAAGAARAEEAAAPRHDVLAGVRGRVVLVGDVHGCASELEALLDRIRPTPDDAVVLVGDVVNKGPASAAAVRLARAAGALAVRGNHDAFALSVLAQARATGADPPDKMAWVAELADEDVEWLEALPYSLALEGRGVLCVHAGLVPGVGLHAQEADDLLSIRDVVSTKGGGWARATKPGAKRAVAWAAAWDDDPAGLDGERPHVVFGHDAKRGLQVGRYSTGLDTGCVYGGALTACVLPPEGAAPAGVPVGTPGELVRVEAFEEYVPVGKPVSKNAA